MVMSERPATRTEERPRDPFAEPSTTQGDTGAAWMDDLAEEQEEQRAARARRVYRSRHNKVVAGVCGGLGEYFGIDPLLLRIAFIVLTIGGGSGVLLYLIGWIVIPEADDTQMPIVTGAEQRNAPLVIGVALALVGITLLMRTVSPWFDDRLFWPLVLIGIGVLVAVNGGRRSRA